MQLTDYLDRESVAVGLTARTKTEALELLVDIVTRRELVEDRERLLTALRQRENVVSTGIGNGVAIPHADLPEIDGPRLFLGVFPEGVDFQALDEGTVTTVFLLLGTPRTPGLHMKILARIARMSKHPEFKDLCRCASAEDALALLQRLDARH